MKNHRSRFPFVGVILVLLLIAAGAAAQVPTGSITGTLVDPQGLAVPDATVKITNEGTGATYESKTSGTGAYLIATLHAGIYKVEVTVSGFRSVAITGIKLDAGTQYSVPPIQLELGQATETITVQAGTNLVQTTNAQVSTTVQRSQIDGLPLFNRSPLTLLGSQPGVNQNGRTVTVINGLRPSSGNVTLDGINIQDNFIRANSLDFLPNLLLLGQIAEFTVTTQNAGVEQGGGASQVSFVTASGTNNWHGEGFYYYRGSALSSNEWFTNKNQFSRPNHGKPFLLQHQTGGNIGGPIFKNKLFVYGYYEAFRRMQQTAKTPLVLTGPARQGIFTYVATCTTTCPTGITTGSIQTVNLLTLKPGLSSIDPFIASLLTRVPTTINTAAGDSAATFPTQLLNTGGFSFNQRSNRIRDNYGFRLDYSLTQNHQFSGIWAWNRDIVDRFDIDASFNTVPIVANNDAKKFLSVAWRWSISPTLTNEVRGGFNFAPGTFKNTRDFGSDPVFVVPATIFNNPDVNFRDQGRDTDTYSLQDNASWTRGNHAFKFGYQHQGIRTVPFNDAGINPTFTLGISATNPNGLVQANFPGNLSSTALTNANNLFATLLGFVASGSQSFNVTSTTSGFVPNATNLRSFPLNSHSFYFGDSWRFRPRLTFTYGLRYEYIGRFDESNGLLLNPDIPRGTNPIPVLLSNATIVFAGEKNGRPVNGKDLNNFAPQIGVAWDPWGDGKTAIRAGYSVHFVNDEAIRGPDNATGANPGLFASNSALNTSVTPASTALNVRIAQGLPTVGVPTFQVPRTALDNRNQLGSPQTIFTVDPKLRTPYVHEWNLTVSREIGWNTAIDLRYIANQGIKLYRGLDFNQVQDMYATNGFLADFLRARSNGFLALNRPVTSPGCTSATCAVFNPAFNANIPGSQVLTVFPNLAAAGLLGNATIRGLIQNGQPGELAATYHVNNLNGSVQTVPNPFAFVTDMLTNYSTSNYHAGVVEVRRRFGSGFNLQANYTFSKVLTDSSGTGQTKFDPLLDNARPELEKSRADFNITHAFKTNFLYELPFGSGKRMSSSYEAINRIIGGWAVTSSITWQTGAPFSILSGRGTLNRAGRSGGNTAVALLPGGQVSSLVGVQFSPTIGSGNPLILNPSIINPSGANAGRGVGDDAVACNISAFAGQIFCHPEPGQVGNLQRNMFTGPSAFFLDFSVTKKTRITERLSFEFRAEFFNFLNHPVFFTRNQSIGSTAFGQMTETLSGARVTQLAARIIF